MHRNVAQPARPRNTNKPPRPRTCHDELEELGALAADVVHATSRARPSGMYSLDVCGIDRAFVRWAQGECSELVCSIAIAQEQALFLEDVADCHEELMDAFGFIGWDVHTVDGLIAPTCPECDGAGGHWHNVTLPSTSHVGGFVKCVVCDGQGGLS